MFIGIVFPSLFLCLSCFLFFFHSCFCLQFSPAAKKRNTRETLAAFFFRPEMWGITTFCNSENFTPCFFPFFSFSWYHIASDPCSGIPLFQKKEKKKKGHQLYDLPTPGKKARKSPLFFPRHGIREMWISSPGAISPQIKGEFPLLSFFFLLYLHPRPEEKRSGEGIRKSSSEFNIRGGKGVSKRLTIYLCSIFVGKLLVAL